MKKPKNTPATRNFVAKHGFMQNKGGVHKKDDPKRKHKLARRKAKLEIRQYF